MDAIAQRRYAIGPIAPTSEPSALAPALNVDVDTWAGEPARLELATGVWIVTSHTASFEAARPLAAEDHIALVLECWNAFDRNATIGRFRIERHAGPQFTTTHEDVLYPELARAGVLPGVANEWLLERVRKLAAPAKEKAADRKEREQRERAVRILTSLVDAGVLALVDGKTVASIADRARIALFKISTTKADRVEHLKRVLRDSVYVAAATKNRSNDELTAAIRTALDIK